MKRGEIWTVSGAGYTGKPRPAVIVQNDLFDSTASVGICVFTSHETGLPLLRLPVSPSESNGLRSVSRLMVDKITTVNRAKLARRASPTAPLAAQPTLLGVCTVYGADS